MERIIRQITEHFVTQLPGSASYYRIDDLEESGFPPFLVRRIHIELQWNLDESMILPQTDWANTDSEAVHASWERFLTAIHAEVRLPASYAKAVIETAVADIVEMLVQPRQNIPDILFGGEKVLSAPELAERTDLLVVYPHFARVLGSYMKRKNREELRRDRCKEIIEQVDDRVTERYTPLQWAQMLDPLFTLAGTHIDTDLLRLFFEDRAMDDTARAFDAMDGTISRAEFIEVLSSPERLMPEQEPATESPEPPSATHESPRDMAPAAEPETESDEAAEEEQDSEAKGDEAERVNAKGALSERTAAGEGDPHKAIEPEPDFEVDREASDAREQEDEEEGGKEQEQGTERLFGIHHQNRSAERPTEPAASESGEKETGEGPSLNDIFSDDTDDPATEGPQEQQRDGGEQQGNPSGVRAVPGEEETSETAPEEAPIWMRFVDEDEEKDGSEEEAGEYDEEIRAQDEDKQEKEEDDVHEDQNRATDYIDEPVIDLNREQQHEDARRELDKALADQRTYFVEELFDGSDRAYNEAIADIAGSKTWKEASKRIEQNIFNRNMINIYSNAAVDFTDRLQSYYMEKTKS